MKSRSIRLLAGVLVTFFSLLALDQQSLPAQSTYASIIGTVRDATGASIPEALVRITNLSDHSSRLIVSGATGEYKISELTAGSYKIAVTKTGIGESPEATIAVASGQHLRTDFKLTAADAGLTPAMAAQLEAMEAKMEQRFEQRLEQLRAELENKKAADQTVKTETRTPHGPLLASNAKEPDVLGLPSPGSGSGSPVLMPGPSPALQAPEPPPAPAVPAAPAVDNETPFADYDWTWLNGNPRNKDVAFDSKFFTPEIRADLTYTYDFNKPSDNSMGGSSELFRSNEIQLEQLGIGGDFHLDNVRARFMTQFGEYSEATIRNDPSYAKGQWNLNDADRYLSEAYGGYHINWMKGMNIDAGIFMSYIGLFSYYNFDNWAYQPSYVSSNTPWFFQGVRIQIFPTHHLKIEPWIVNGWQSYASSNTRKGLGGQIKYTPYPWLNFVSNNYGLGHDDLYTPHRGRIHTDNSLEIKYYDKPGNGLDKIAFTFTGDLGCEFGEGVSCHNDHDGHPKQSFIGYMLYNRFWFHRDMFALTLGGGQINNPGRYLVLIPPINGETAASASINSPYFTFNPGDQFKAWDTSATFDYMPKQWITFRFEGDYRHANVPYWSGAAGVTPPPGTNNNFPTQYACMDGANSGVTTLTSSTCANDGGVWYPDLRKDEMLFDIDLMVKF
jgi:hypothetical protein